MSRLITIDNHPPEIEVVHAQSPGDFLTIAHELLPDDSSPVQAIVWARDNSAQDGEITDIIEAFNQNGHEAYGEELLGSDRGLNFNQCIMWGATFSRGYPVIESTENPFLLELISTVQVQANITDLITFYGYSRDSLRPHFDVAEPVPQDAAACSFQENKFMGGRSIRALYTQVTDSGEETGTLLWSPSEIEFYPFYDAVVKGNLARVQSWAIDSPDIFSSENSYQLRNGDVIIMPDNRKWPAHKYPLHAAYTSDLCQNSETRITHRLDILYD